MPTQPNIGQLVKDYWFVVVVFCSLVITYANNETKHVELERRMEKVELKTELNDATFLQLQKDIVEIKTILEYLKQQYEQRK